MKCNFNQEFKGLDGTPIYRTETEALTLKWFASDNLLANDQSADQVEKMKRFSLAKKIYDSPEGDFTIEELNEVKTCIGKHPSVLLVGLACEMIENAND